jgi:hypothetical protein
MSRRTHARHRVRREGAPNYNRGGGAHHSAKAFFIDELLETVRVVLRATDSAREQIASLPNWQSQPSADGLQL